MEIVLRFERSWSARCAWRRFDAMIARAAGAPSAVSAAMKTNAEVSVSASQARDDPARERLGHAPFLVHPDGEHQFLKSLTRELADLLDQRLGRADQAGGADEAGVDQLGFPWVQIGVVARACGNAGAR